MSPLPTRYTNSVELLLYAIAGTIHNFFAKPNMDQILANQRFIEIDQIYSDLHRLRDWEQVRSERSDQVVYQIDSKELRIHVTHGRKTEFDFGIDLIYEIVGEKYVVIQYKRLGRSIDSVQMEKMRRHFCPPWQQVACRIKEELPHRKVRLGTLCTPYYKIVDEDPFSGDYVPLCFLRARMKEEELKTANPDLLAVCRRDLYPPNAICGKLACILKQS